MGPLSSDLVLTLLNKMVVQNVNIVTFLILSAPFSFLHLFLSAFGVRLHSLLCTPLIVFLHQLHTHLYGQSPDYSSLWVFGCACFVSLPPHERTKLQPRVRLCCFLGYGISEKGFCCYDPISHRLRVSRHVEFWEHHPFISLQQFPASSSSKSPIFTDLVLPLYPELVKDSSTSAASPDDSSPVLSSASDPSVLDPVAPPSPEYHIGKHSSFYSGKHSSFLSH
ncbi:hypothetical protein ACOSQ3_003432 [Xanthoceras sorbifolium]